MTKINIEKQQGIIVVSSRQVAEHFEKRHDNVVRDIENLIVGMLKIEETPKTTNLFYETEYKNEQNQQIYKAYLLTRDGFTLLTMGFTGAKALEWKLKYIEAFNEMEQKRPPTLRTEYLPGLVSLINVTRKVMKDQGHTPEKIAEQMKLFYDTYGVPTVEPFVKPSYEQLIITTTVTTTETQMSLIPKETALTDSRA